MEGGVDEVDEVEGDGVAVGVGEVGVGVDGAGRGIKSRRVEKERETS